VADSARACGSANLLTFDEDGQVHAQSTDGHGLVRAFELQAPNCDLSAGPVVIMGAGGASRAAVAAMLNAGAPEVRIVNRTLARAEELVFAFPGDKVTAFELTQVDRAFTGAVAVVNAASGGPLPLFDALDDAATVMDMTYRPLRTNWLAAAADRGLATVDGLNMLIEQARPSFEAFYGAAPNPAFDIRALALTYLGEA
jgi:shikimate dehydrogenase